MCNWSPKREGKKNEEEKVFEEIIFEIFPDLLEEINYSIKKPSKSQADFSCRMR